MQAVCTRLYDTYGAKKTMDDEFKKAQLRFLQNHYRPIHRFKTFEDCSGIKNHLGSIWDHHVRLNDKMNDIEIEKLVAKAKKVITLMLHKNEGIKSPDHGLPATFAISEYFHSFRRTPLSVLAFASSCDGPHWRNLFPYNQDERMSITRVLKTIKSIETDGELLENLCKYAIIASLACKGFKNMNMAEWLPYFCAEFELNSLPGGIAPTINYGSELLVNAFQKIKMPFCTPLAEEWPLKLLRFVQADCKCLVGRLENAPDADGLLYELQTVPLSQSRADASNQVFSSTLKRDKPLLVMECKDHQREIHFGRIQEILGKFEPYSARIQLIVASGFEDMNGIVTKLTDYVTGNNMFAVYVHTGKGDNIPKVELLCGDARVNNASCLILFSVKKLTSPKPSKNQSDPKRSKLTSSSRQV